MASAILVTTNMELAESICTDRCICKRAFRGEIIQKSLDNYGHILVTRAMEDAIDAANSIASEHLEIVTANPFEVMTKIKAMPGYFHRNIQAVSSEIILQDRTTSIPFNGTAKFFSPLSVDDFIKNQALSLTQEMHLRRSIQISKFAEAEHLTAHANSIKVDLKNKRKNMSVMQNRIGRLQKKRQKRQILN